MGAPTFEPVQRSVYTGSQYMGRYVQTGLKAFEAFDAADHPIGVFSSNNDAVAAIGNCWR
jgi:hypothetical protein